MFFLSSFVTTKSCLFRYTYLHFIISTFLEFNVAKKSRGILFSIRHVKDPPLFFTLFNSQILFCSMDIYLYSNIFINFLANLQQIHLRFLRGWPSIFVCIIFQHLPLLLGTSVIILMSEVHLPLWASLDTPYYQIQAARNTNQLSYLPIVHMCFSIFCNLHPVVFAPLLILYVPSHTSAFQQLLHILPCFILSFCMYFYYVILSIISMQLHHKLLLLHSLLLHNGVFDTLTPRNIVGC